MSGLVSYESSDEEEVEQQPEPKPLKQTQDTTGGTNEKSKPLIAEPATALQKPVEKAEAIIGPQIGPAPAPAAGPSFPPLEEAPLEDDEADAGPGLPPGSPYTATRALLRDLTLPPIPNTDMPASPPGSPPPATSAKFERFLELKKQGVHFNSKVAQNPSLRNPALTEKLLAFVELGGAADQYQTTLPADIWDPAAFPRWAYKEQLKQSQADMEKARARGKGAPVEFVAATASSVEDGQGGGLKTNTGKRKTRFDA
ncbi:HCNGP-like protein-domain-containing protein [Annulohypoxylon maeteangense]|uniref:HCNGP-like protein-domain-containing protein n=1 Tax=Annulohypoxylon maeteangense TaxID=1927788 RepID=UPI0020084EEA|nr:HCNGP-like protein-domain-containing protein [Annulohypoxylon maeteangense]KAI0890476.1 HCNGP-like protein-domain-containing protein [Annulohypoxylon maeteangense]